MNESDSGSDMDDLFPLDSIAENLAKWGCAPRKGESGIEWENDWGRSEITVERIDTKTVDGHQIIGVARCTHQLRGPAAVEVNELSAAKWNRMASLSALLPGVNRSGPVICSRVTLFNADDQMRSHFHPRVLCTEAYMQPAALMLAARGAGPGPEYFGLSNGGAPPPYAEREFIEVARNWTEHGIYSNGGPDGLSAELPYDEGALPAILKVMGYGDRASPEGSNQDDGRTYLLQMFTGQSHPCLGRGLLTILSAPAIFADLDHCASTVNALNQWEAAAVDMPPMYGAWCLDPSGARVSHVMFVPNELCAPGLPATIFSWMVQRAWRIRPELEKAEREAGQ